MSALMTMNPYINSSLPLYKLQTLTELSFTPCDFIHKGQLESQPFDLIKDKFKVNLNQYKQIMHTSTKLSPTIPKINFYIPKIPLNIVNNLCARFLINIPQSQKYDAKHILFMCQEAYWFYLDFCLRNYEEQSKQALINDGQTASGLIDSFTIYKDINYHFINQNLPKCKYENFTYLLLKHSGILTTLQNYYYHKNKVDKNLLEDDQLFLTVLIQHWQEYCAKIPVCGAIILDEECEHMLMVKGYNSNSWTFPKGKINEDETDHDCAVREIYEEIGLDISSIIDPDAFLMLPSSRQLPKSNDLVQCGAERRIRRSTKLFIVKGVSRSTALRPVARYEIMEIKWFPLQQLYRQMSYHNQQDHSVPSSTTLICDGHKFQHTIPILIGLKRALKQRRKKAQEAKVAERVVLDDNAISDDRLGSLKFSLQFADDSVLPSKCAHGNDMPPSVDNQSPKTPTSTTMIKLSFDEGVLKTPVSAIKTSSKMQSSNGGDSFRKINSEFFFRPSSNHLPHTPLATTPQPEVTDPSSASFEKKLHTRRSFKFEELNESTFEKGEGKNVFENFVTRQLKMKCHTNPKTELKSPSSKWFHFKLDIQPLLHILNKPI